MKMMEITSISSLAVISIILITGCARPEPLPKPIGLPQKTVLANNIAYHTTWDHYNECWTSNYVHPDAMCGWRLSNGSLGGPFIQIKPYIDEALQTSSSLVSFCNVVRANDLLPSYNQENTCKDYAKQVILKNNNYDKAYSWGLIDQKTWLLHDGKILEAYQAGLIDKNTADLYLQKQSIDAAERQVKAAQAQADATTRAAHDAYFNQQQQNMRRYY